MPLDLKGELAVLGKQSDAQRRTTAAVLSNPKESVKHGHTLDNDEALTVKIAAFGESGSGKTYALVPLLELGYKIAVINTDFGGNGLVTVRNELIRRDERQLLKNIWFADFPVADGYRSVMAFLRDTFGVYPDLTDFNPDWLVWEGFSTFQMAQVDDELTESLTIDDEERWTHWAGVRRGTIRALAYFLSARDPRGKRWHKYLTCLEGDEREVSKAKKAFSGASAGLSIEETLKKAAEQAEKKPAGGKGGTTGARAPLIQGSSQALLPAGFDLVLEMVRLSDGPNMKYTYNSTGVEGIKAKNRGFGLDPSMSADFGELWKRIALSCGISLPPQQTVNLGE